MNCIRKVILLHLESHFNSCTFGAPQIKPCVPMSPCLCSCVPMSCKNWICVSSIGKKSYVSLVRPARPYTRQCLLVRTSHVHALKLVKWILQRVGTEHWPGNSNSQETNCKYQWQTQCVPRKRGSWWNLDAFEKIVGCRGASTAVGHNYPGRDLFIGEPILLGGWSKRGWLSKLK